MSQREANILWLRDILEHLSACQERLQFAEDGAAVSQLADAMLRDLERCQRLCENLRRRARLGPAA
jgi:hypothetical protein